MAHLSLIWETSGLLLETRGHISYAGNVHSSPGGGPSKEMTPACLIQVNSQFFCEVFKQQEEVGHHECLPDSFIPATVLPTPEENKVLPALPRFKLELIELSLVVYYYFKEKLGRQLALPWRLF